MNNYTRNGRDIQSYTVYEFAELVNQTPQNIRYKARNNRFKTEITGISAHRNAYEWIIEVDLLMFMKYMKEKCK